MASWKLELPTRRRASSSLGEGPPGLDLDDITLAPSAGAAPPAGQPWLKGLLSFCLAPVAAPHPAVLILLRHGESEWNASDRFTGWMDVGLTELGKREAAAAGRTLKATGLDAIDDLHSSALGRTVDTLSLCVEALGKRLPTGEAAHGPAGDAPRLTYCRSWQLNERHYGSLTGMAKNDARQKYGANQVQRWRRAWRETPPRMAPDHAARPGIAAAYAAAGGSPKDLPSRGAGPRRAHVIRTIIHHLDGGGEERADLELQLAALEIPYATPLVYTFALPGGPTGKLCPFADEMQRGCIRGTFLSGVVQP
ncbi:hypothetical protein JL720_13354 [Aureococcus anophagefferens]|nr:hypothetical protein JL720_13354 [Aureococcus anophagefferens]